MPAWTDEACLGAAYDVNRAGIAWGRGGSSRGHLVLSAPAVVVASCHAPPQSVGKERIKAMEKRGSGKPGPMPPKAISKPSNPRELEQDLKPQQACLNESNAHPSQGNRTLERPAATVRL